MEHTELAPEPPIQPEPPTSEPQIQQIPSRRTRRWLMIALPVVIVLLLVLGYVGYRQLTSSQTQGTNSSLSTANSAVFNGVKATYITLPLTSSQAQLDPVYSSVPSWYTAAGHYLVLDPRGVKYGLDNSEGGKLLYDGKVVYDGPYIYNFALSANGLHYAYELDTDKTRSSKGEIQLFVDGKQVKTLPGTSPIYHTQVSNDGKHYAYFTPDVSTANAYDMDVVADGKTIFKAGWIDAIKFDASLAHYIIMQGFTSDSSKTSVIVDGKTTATDVVFQGTALPNLAMSDNGKHYMYTDGTKVYVDGKAKQQIQSVAAMMVTDSGSYAVADPLSGSVYVSNKTYAIAHSFAQSCNPGCSGNHELSLTPDGSHYIYGTEGPSMWSLDGHSISPVGDIVGVDFVNGTMYFYRWHD